MSTTRKIKLSKELCDPVLMDLGMKMIADVHKAMNLSLQLLPRREQRIVVLCLLVGNLLRGIEIESLSVEDETNVELRTKVIDNALVVIRRFLEQSREL